MFLRPCFLVVDREHAGSISTRKLVIETAKFNVVTAYSFEEAAATLDRFPRLHGCVVTGGNDREAVRFLRQVRDRHPAVKLVLTGNAAEPCDVCDSHVESYAPDLLLAELRRLFPMDAARADDIENELEAKGE